MHIFYVHPFDYTAFVFNGKAGIPQTGLTTRVGWLLLLQLTVLSRSAIVVYCGICIMLSFSGFYFNVHCVSVPWTYYKGSLCRGQSTLVTNGLVNYLNCTRVFILYHTVSTNALSSVDLRLTANFKHGHDKYEITCQYQKNLSYKPFLIFLS